MCRGYSVLLYLQSYIRSVGEFCVASTRYMSTCTGLKRKGIEV
jgi:hypothetical protein